MTIFTMPNQRLIRPIAFVLTLTLCAAVLFTAARDVLADGPEAVPFEQIDAADAPADVAAWVATMRESQGLHRLDADGKTWILVAWGPKPTGGHEVVVTAVERSATGVIVLQVNLKAPGESDIVTQAITYPHALIAIGQTDEPLAAEFGPWPTPWLSPGHEGTPLVGERVFLQLPLAGQVLGDTVRVKGAARLFEGAFRIILEDGHSQLINEVATASAGGPEWGTFDLEFKIPEPTNAHGLLIIAWQDMKDGNMVEEVAVPVHFAAFANAGDDSAFADIGQHWARSDIEAAVRAGFVNGYPDGTFKPDNNISRAEFLKMVIAAIGAGTDADVDTATFADTRAHWSLAYVEKAVQLGIIEPADYDGPFEPDRNITRLEMAVQLVRALGHADGLANNADRVDAFSDTTGLSAEARGYLGTAVQLGIFTGYPDGTIGPGKESTRAEAVTMIMRALASHRPASLPDGA